MRLGRLHWTEELIQIAEQFGTDDLATAAAHRDRLRRLEDNAQQERRQAYQAAFADELRATREHFQRLQDDLKDAHEARADAVYAADASALRTLDNAIQNRRATLSQAIANEQAALEAAIASRQAATAADDASALAALNARIEASKQALASAVSARAGLERKAREDLAQAESEYWTAAIARVRDGGVHTERRVAGRP